MKFKLLALLLAAAIATGTVPVILANADNETENAENVLVTLDYINNVLKPELLDSARQNILEELGFASMKQLKSAINDQTNETEYADLTLEKGQIIYLSNTCEAIYRGGGAVAVTSSDIDDFGVLDISTGFVLSSGEALSFGHIYCGGETEATKGIIVTGSKGFFTVRGEYEIVG